MKKFKCKPVEFFRGIGPYKHFSRLKKIHVHGYMPVSCLHAAYVPESVPVMRKFLGLIREIPVVVRLVVGIGADHQLAIMAGSICQYPRIPFGIRPPQPEFSSLYDVMVSGKHGTGMAAMVIACHEILFLVMNKHGIAHIVILPPAGIHTLSVKVHVIERFMRHRPVCKPVLAVESHEFRTLRKTNLVIFIYKSGNVGPIQE